MPAPNHMLNFVVAVFESLMLISVWRFLLCFLAGATLGFVWERRAERDAG